MLLAIAFMATLTVTAFALSSPGPSDPGPGDLPRIVSEMDSGPASAAATVTPSGAGTTQPVKKPTKVPPKAASPAPSRPAATPNGSGSGDDDHEVVKPRLHESDGDEHSGRDD